MGTTQRITPGVPGEPNWKSLAISITAIANNISSDQQLQADAENAADKLTTIPSKSNQKALDRINRRQQNLSKRVSQNTQSALRNLVKTGGGSKAIAKGRSLSLGAAGVARSKRITSFISSVHGSGLSVTLRKIGFGSLHGKNLKEVIDYLLTYLSDSSSGLDEVAANIASCETLTILADDAKTPEDFEKKLKLLVDENGVSEIICTFFGIYLFEHLAQRFEEKISQIKGEAVSAETFKIIKEDILGQMKIISREKSISSIDWKGSEGKNIEQKVFESIIKIYE